MQRKQDPIQYCKSCNTILKRKRYGETLESMNNFMRRKYCNQKCMAKGQEIPNPGRNRLKYMHLKKPSCETCGSIENICGHHKDGNYNNNTDCNLMTLCGSCHTSLHHRQGDMLTKKEKTPCYACGKQSYRRGLCPTHLTRFKKYGSPYLTKIKIGRSYQLVWDRGIRSGQISADSQQESLSE